MKKVNPSVGENVNKPYSSNVPSVQAIQTCKPPTISPAEILNEIKAFLKSKYKIAQERKAFGMFRFYKILTREGHSSGDAVASEMKVSRQTVVNYARDLKEMGLIIAERGYYGKYVPVYPLDFFNKKYCKKIEKQKPPTPPSNDIYIYNNNISSRDISGFKYKFSENKKKKIPKFFAVIANNNGRDLEMFYKTVKSKYGSAPDVIIVKSDVEKSKVVITTNEFVKYVAKKYGMDVEYVIMTVKRLIYWACHKSRIKYEKMTNITGLCCSFIKNTKPYMLTVNDIFKMVEAVYDKNRKSNRKIESVGDIATKFLNTLFFLRENKTERSVVPLPAQSARENNYKNILQI